MAPKNNKHFASVVRETMAQLGLTQAKVAERGGPSDTTLRKILDGEAVRLSTLTLAKLDAAFGWDPGSAAAVLNGQKPIVSGVLRDGQGRRMYAYWAVQGADQPYLERLRLAVILGDVRDHLETLRHPQLGLVVSQLDEAIELATRSVARDGDGDLTADNWKHAVTHVAAQRAARSIRREGATYVVDERAPEVTRAAPPYDSARRPVVVMAAEIRDGDVRLRNIELPKSVTTEKQALEALRVAGEDQGYEIRGRGLGHAYFDMTWVGDDVEIVIEVKQGSFLVEAMQQLLEHARAYAGRQSDLELAARTGAGKTREQVEYERHAAAAEESHPDGPEGGA